MSESDTMFNERDRRCAAVQLMPSTDPSYDNRAIVSTLKMVIRTVQRLRAHFNASDEPLEVVKRKYTVLTEKTKNLRLIKSFRPPSSPDLNPLDYFVWSYVKNITNMTSHNTKASLIADIRGVFTELLRLWPIEWGSICYSSVRSATPSHTQTFQ